jgi:DNA-binding protein H-NS
MRLSECWDRIKNEDKERKKERAQQKTAFKQNFDDSMLKLQEFNQNYQAQQPSIAEATKQLDELVAHIRGLEHGRDELRTLRSEVQAARKPILERMHAQENERHNQDQEREKQRRQKILDVKQQAEDLLKNSESLDADGIEAQRDVIMDLISSSSMGKADKQEIERQLKPLRDLISEKRESSLLTLSDDDRQSLQQLKEVLKQRKERRQEIKTQIDALRKTSGASGLDFEQAMNFNAQVAAEKERLEKINQGVQEIEQKIAQLSKR